MIRSFKKKLHWNIQVKIELLHIKERKKETWSLKIRSKSGRLNDNQILSITQVQNQAYPKSSPHWTTKRYLKGLGFLKLNPKFLLYFFN